MQASLTDVDGTILGTTGISVIPRTGETVHLTEGSQQEIVPPDGMLFRVEDVHESTVTVSAQNLAALSYMLHIRDRSISQAEAIDET